MLHANADYLTVPDDRNLLASAGHGVDPTGDDNDPYGGLLGVDPSTGYYENYDPAMPPAWRCDQSIEVYDYWGEGHGPFGLPERPARTPQTACQTACQNAPDWHTSDDCSSYQTTERARSWYRLPTGKGLPTAPPGVGHCGTTGTGWLSGWPAAADGQPGLHGNGCTEPSDSQACTENYATHADGSLPPPVGLPPAAGTVCFDFHQTDLKVGWDAVDMRNTCLFSTQIRAVSCGAFALYELPPAPNWGMCSGYCLA